MDQVTLKKLLKDPVFMKWFKLTPEFNDPGRYPEWALYVQKKEGSRWSWAFLRSYRDGLKFVAKNIKVYHDMSITNRRHESRPPVVKIGGKRQYYLSNLITPELVNPLPERATHKWCTYCRRPTLFAYFTNHPAIGKRLSNGGERRCTICGAREGYITDYLRIAHG